jgi:hypothetical protein
MILDWFLCASVSVWFVLGGFYFRGTEAQAKQVQIAPQLFKRYDRGAAPNRITEDVLTLSLSVKPEERTQVAIRVCSKESLPFALATAGADPFYIADLLTNGYAYPVERVMFLRSEDCLFAKDRSEPITEIWALRDAAQLPTHVEALKGDEVKLVSLGKRQTNRGVCDYRSAVTEMIGKLRLNPAAKGIVFGYFLERPSATLRRRLREVTSMLEQSGLSADRYLVRPMQWNDEVSTYPPDSEPQYPSISIVEVSPQKGTRNIFVPFVPFCG